MKKEKKKLEEIARKQDGKSNKKKILVEFEKKVLEENDFVCDHCSEPFTTMANLEKHIEFAHEPKQPIDLQ